MLVDRLDLRFASAGATSTGATSGIASSWIDDAGTASMGDGDVDWG